MNAPLTSPWSGLAEQRQMLVRVLNKRCADRSIVEDLAHDTLLRAARYRPRELDEDRLPAWLRRVAMNVLNDHLRRAHRLPLRDATEDEWMECVEARERAPGEDPRAGSVFRAGGLMLECEDALHHVYEGLQSLGDRDRAAIARACAEAPDASDAADVDGDDAARRARGRRKGRLFRARRRLRESVARSLRRREHGAGAALACGGAS